MPKYILHDFKTHAMKYFETDELSLPFHANGVVVSGKWFVYYFSLNFKWCVNIFVITNGYCA